MAIVKGFDLLVIKGGVQIGKQTDCSLDIDTELIEKAGTSGWKEYLAGLCGWSISCSGLIVDKLHTSMLREQVAKTKLTLSFKIGTETFSGQAYVKSTKYSGQVNGCSKWQVSFEGSGALS